MSEFLSLISNKILIEQKEALEKLDEYLSDNEEKSFALIKMPTGTGKTGVIAYVSHAFDNYKNILIITPNNQLPKQIKNEISLDFWNKIGISNLCSKCKYKIIKGIGSNIKITGERSIFIVTIQALLSIKKQKEHLYNQLKDNINLIIFDEGHREPSLKWRKIIEAFQKKTILFTATPYRNDKLGFKISSRYSYNLSYGKALKQGYIKKVQFEAIDNKIINDKEAFAKYIYNLHKDGEKIIIRSDNSQDISSIVNNINNLCINDAMKRGIAVGIHSTFKNEDYFKKIIVNH